MAAFSSDPNILIAAFLRFARTQPDAIAWAAAIQSAALTASVAGDLHVASLGNEGGSTAWMRELPANQLAQLCEIVLQRLESEAANTAAGLTGDAPPGNVRSADFSCNLSTLG